MTTTAQPPQTTSPSLAVLEGALAQPAYLTDKALLDLLDQADDLVSRAAAVRARLIALAEQSEASLHEQGCTTTAYLIRSSRHTPAQARKLLREAVDEFITFPLVGEAALQGRVSAPQVAGILRGLSHLPATLPADKHHSAQTMMIGFATEHDPAALARLSHHLWEVLDPAGADQAEASRLEAERQIAEQNRYLHLAPDHHGSYLLSGRLPVTEGEELLSLITAHTASVWSRRHERPVHEVAPLTKAQVRADALMTIVRQASSKATAPRHGGDRPRVTVLIDLDTLRTGLGPSGRTATGELLSPGQVRRLACDADLIPAVLDTPGAVVDVGRQRRLVTPMIRLGLDARDRGCVFPGCDRQPADCEAHHVQPWWAGGPTDIGNLALVCPHHHGLVEPGRQDPWDADDPSRWSLRINGHGLPVVIPPATVDPRRTPRRHSRFTRPPPNHDRQAPADDMGWVP